LPACARRPEIRRTRGDRGRFFGHLKLALRGEQP
jgi:hypothetical protein